MSTHAVVQFKDEEGIVAIFKFSDGNPKWIGEYLMRALDFAWPLPRYEASDFAAAFVTACKLDLRKMLSEIEQRDRERGETPHHKTAGGEVYVIPRCDELAWQYAGDSRYAYMVEMVKQKLIVTAWRIEESGVSDQPGGVWIPEWHRAKIYRGAFEGLAAMQENPKLRLRPWSPKPMRKTRAHSTPARLVRI